MDKMALGTDYVKELETYRKKCRDLEKKSENDENRCFLLENEVKNLKEKNEELEDKFDELMIENKVLECEKQKAETDASSLKEKVKELLARVCELESLMQGVNKKNELLKFKEIGCSSNKMGPCTPGVTRLPFYCDIDVSDDENDNSNDDDMNEFEVNYSDTKRKRKKAANIIVSDEESDEMCNDIDDNAPICTLMRQHNSKFKTESEDEVEENAKKPRLKLKKTESKNKQDKSSQSDDEVAESEGGSLSGFIIDNSECGDELVDVLFSDDYKETIDKIARKKISDSKWDLEGEMLADFGKDPELCMRAICCLYRQQTKDEKVSQQTKHRNGRGFSHTDAYRASKVAEFLTDGDSAGDLNKTVEELKEYDSNGIELCMQLAAKYSKQLFTIYQNKEDKYILPK